MDPIEYPFFDIVTSGAVALAAIYYLGREIRLLRRELITLLRTVIERCIDDDGGGDPPDNG